MGELSDAPDADLARLAVAERVITCIGARLLLEAPNEVQGRRTDVTIVVDAVHDIAAAPIEDAS